MARDYMKRINALRENYMSHRVEMDILDAYYVTQGFKETEGQPWQIQKATGMKKVYENKPIFIQDNELLVGGVAFKPRAGILNPDSACSVIEKELDTISTRKYDPFYLSDENKKLFMEEVAPYWRGKCVLDRWNAMMPEDVRTMRDGGMLYVDKKFVRGYGENTPGWRTLLAKGIKGIKEEAQEKLAALDDAAGEDTLKQMIFYKSLIITADGIVALANRHADLAEEMAAKETDEIRKAELLKIAEVNRHVPENPPRNFYEALQSMLTYEFCIFMEQNASSYNLGRMDQYLIEYYKKDIEEGIMTQEDAQELLDCFWIKIAEMGLFQDGESAAFSAGYNMTVQVCAGGIDKYGNDAVNDLSYMTIQATEDTALKEPNMTVRYSISKNPDSFLRKAAECIRMGRTMPAIAIDPILNLLGLNKVKLNPKSIEKKLGFIGEPMTLGFILGGIIGILGNVGKLTSMAGWGSVFTAAIATAAIMAIFPKIASMFAQAFAPITEAARVFMKNSGDREWYIAVNDAVGYGEPATLTSGLLLIPIMVVIATVLPGNQVLPVVDLLAIPYMVQGLVAVYKGNMSKILVAGVIWFSLGLLMCTYTAPLFTDVARGAGFAIPAGAAMITSFNILGKPMLGFVFLAFLSGNPLFIGIAVAVYAVAFFIFKTKNAQIVAYLDRQADKNDAANEVEGA